MGETNWYGKSYYSLDAYCKNTFHYKCYRVALNAHMSCPNRDGTLGTRGCLFCSAGGSGEFAVELGETYKTRYLSRTPFKPNGQISNTQAVYGQSMDKHISIEEQLQDGIRRIAGKLGQRSTSSPSLTDALTAPTAITEKNMDTTPPYIIAYFQAYTNTYGPISYLEQIFSQTLSHPLVCGISIATRPDCLPDEILKLLRSLKERFPDKFIWVELGLQTIHETTANLIRRGYDLNCFETALNSLRQLDIPVIVHVILGLPGEMREQMLETISYLNNHDIFGVKLQLLHVLEGTDLADLYRQGAFQVLTKDNYLDLLADCIEHLSPRIILHRVTGDGPKRLLIAPKWSGNKKDVLNSFHRLMRERGTRQGSYCSLHSQ